MTAVTPETREQAPAAGAPPWEGTDGRFSQSWFPICLSTELKAGEVKGFDFLDGRIAVFRDKSGVAHVLSALCPHLGADISCGTVVDDTVRCPFHFWRYDGTGQCVATGVGDPVPPRARLFRFPTDEKYGMIFAFNGERPLFDIPEFSARGKPLRLKVGLFDPDNWPVPADPAMRASTRVPVDPWVICCNTPDMQHQVAVHGVSYPGGKFPHDTVVFDKHSMRYIMKATHQHGETIDFRLGVNGTNIYFQEGELDGRWFGFLLPLALPRPRQCELYLACLVEEDAADPQGTQAYLDAVWELEARVLSEDLVIVNSGRFRPQMLTRSDVSLGRFLKYLSDYPRAHPSADYIR